MGWGKGAPTAQGRGIALDLMLRAQLHAGVVQAQGQDAGQQAVQAGILRDVTLRKEGQSATQGNSRT